jgi:hypothetical protein
VLWPKYTECGKPISTGSYNHLGKYRWFWLWWETHRHRCYKPCGNTQWGWTWLHSIWESNLHRSYPKTHMKFTDGYENAPFVKNQSLQNTHRQISPPPLEYPFILIFWFCIPPPPPTSLYLYMNANTVTRTAVRCLIVTFGAFFVPCDLICAVWPHLCHVTRYVPCDLWLGLWPGLEN